MGILLLVIGLVIMTVLAVKGVSVLFASLIASVFVLVTAGIGIIPGLTGAEASYMVSFANYVRNYYLMFIFGAMFGKLCEISGATESIARTVVNKVGPNYVCIGIVIAGAILAFGGVNLFVALFALYPLGMSLFREADIPRRFFPGVYLQGVGTFAMTAPFTPSTQNIIPMSYLGTTLSAGLVPGIIGSVFCAVVGTVYIHLRYKQLKKAGEHFVPIPGEDIEIDESRKLPGFIQSLLPLILLIVILNIKIGGVGLSVISALFFGMVIELVIYWAYLPHSWAEMWKNVLVGANNGISSLINTAATVGLGGAITLTPAFQSLAGIVADAAKNGNPYLLVGVSVAALAGISGSASGGLGIAVPICADIFIPLGVNPEAIHRIAVVASSALDSLPHNGFVNTTLGYSKCTHASSYFDIFVVTVAITIIELLLVIALFSMGL